MTDSSKKRNNGGPQSSASGVKRASLCTLGCKVNAFESALIAQSLGEDGWSVVGDKNDADLYIINTCTVTREADRQARQAVRRAIRRNPEARIVVTGCYAQMSPEACAAIPGVDAVVGNARKLDIARLLPGLVRDRGAEATPKVLVDDLDQHVSLPDRLLSGYEGQTRAFVQVQQGCNQGCTFCIIHRARGPSRSLPATRVLQQVRTLAERGYKEIVICGVDLGAYGVDLGGETYCCTLTDLLARICDLEHDFRVRLSSIDPAHIDRRLMQMLAGHRRLCPHLHLSLQSGNSIILKRMKRRYDADRVRRVVAELRSEVPNLVLSADVMVGFPTETRAHFRDTVNMVRQLEVAYPHVFPYSQRPGTPAARIPAERQVPKDEKKRRAAVLRRAGDEVRRRLLASRVGVDARVLVEGGRCPAAGYEKGRAADYIEVWVETPKTRVGEWADVRFESVRGDVLIARPTR